jgi:hypothetical protein
LFPGFGTAEITVSTSGATSRQIEMPSVFGTGREPALINTTLQEIKVVKGR